MTERKPELSGNIVIEKAIERFHTGCTRENLIRLLESIRNRMHCGGQFVIPVIFPPDAAFFTKPLRTGDRLTLTEDLHLSLHRLQTADGKIWLAAFTGEEESAKGERTSTVSFSILQLLKSCREMREEGIILNPWDKSFCLTKELIELIFEADK